MTKTQLILLGAGTVGSLVGGALATGVARDAVTTFCSAVATAPAPEAVTVQPAVKADAGVP